MEEVGERTANLMASIFSSLEARQERKLPPRDPPRREGEKIGKMGNSRDEPWKAVIGVYGGGKLHSRNNRLLLLKEKALTKVGWGRGRVPNGWDAHVLTEYSSNTLSVIRGSGGTRGLRSKPRRGAIQVRKSTEKRFRPLSRRWWAWCVRHFISHALRSTTRVTLCKAYTAALSCPSNPCQEVNTHMYVCACCVIKIHTYAGRQAMLTSVKDIICMYVLVLAVSSTPCVPTIPPPYEIPESSRVLCPSLSVSNKQALWLKPLQRLLLWHVS